MEAIVEDQGCITAGEGGHTSIPVAKVVHSKLTHQLGYRVTSMSVCLPVYRHRKQNHTPGTNKNRRI
jgi:hypothetical protein